MIASHIRTPLVLVVLSLGGCATDRSPTVQPPAPFFQPTSEDSTQLAALASELDTLAMDCAAQGTCEDRVHFTRALVSLFENREAARASFEQVISRTSPLKAGSIKTANVHALHKQVQDRDRHIAELRAQLEASKVIDQDQQERHRKMRAPASVR